MKKEVTYVIIALFLSLVFISPVKSFRYGELSTSTLLRYNTNQILYVGGSGPHNYSRIQDAVDNASLGDTIFVYANSSPYYENILIEKEDIQLIGENKYSTIIDGNDLSDVIQIKSDHVTINGFTVQHSGLIEYPEYNAGIHLFYPSDHNSITENIIINNWNGICLQASKNNTISNNIINNNAKGLLIFADSVYNNISRNLVENNEYGFFFGFTVYNIIIENNIENNSEFGLYLYFFRLQTLQRNNFINNTRHVYFIERFRFAFDKNYFIKNYWDTWIGVGPKILKGEMFTEWVGQKLIPWINFDWIPARKPYTIQV